MSGANRDQSSIAGAWELISDAEQALLVATETHASVIFVAKGRRRFQGEEPSQAEEAEAYRTMLAQAGPYFIAGSVITHQRQYTRNPNATGTDELFEFSIESDVLKLQSIRANGSRGVEMLWRKVNP
jgi:hypothetical protein